MIATCPACQAHYRVPDSAAGKRTTCKKCGQTFHIAAQRATPERTQAAAAPPRAAGGALQLADLDALEHGEAVAVAPLHLAPRESPGAVARAPTPGAGSVVATTGAASSYLRYLRAIGRSAGFLGNSGNLITFFILWFMLAVRTLLELASALTGGMVTFFSLGAWVIVTGWYLAFKMNTVASAAGEREELPGLAEEDWVDGVFWPCVRMSATYLFAFLPVLIFLFVVQGRLAAVSSLGGLGTDGGPAPGSYAAVALVVLAFAGAFAWPMMVLVVSCGDSVLALFRLDLIGETILKSLPAYTLTVLAVYVSFAVEAGVSAFLWSSLGETKDWRANWVSLLLVPMLLVGAKIYFDVVAMRAIGHYYSCFKHKFAWAWD